MSYLDMLDRLLELAEEEGSTGLSTDSQEYQELYDQLFDVLLSIEGVDSKQ